jgi:hypothetical protein
VQRFKSQALSTNFHDDDQLFFRGINVKRFGTEVPPQRFMEAMTTTTTTTSTPLSPQQQLQQQLLW